MVPHNTCTWYKSFEEYKKWNLHIFKLGSPTCLTLDPYVSCTIWEVHHMCLNILFYGDHSLKTCVFSLVNTFIIEKTHKFIASYICYTKNLFQGLTQNNNMKLCKGKYEPKVPPTTPCILKRKNGWMIIPIHPCL
jgi:hypothetical protein